jgi:hypothetical protein
MADALVSIAKGGPLTAATFFCPEGIGNISRWLIRPGA